MKSHHRVLALTSWYGDRSIMPDSSDKFFLRGDTSSGGSLAGLFNFSRTYGSATNSSDFVRY